MVEDYPPDLDATATLASYDADERQFWQLWRLYEARALDQRSIQLGRERGVDTTAIAELLAERPEISALQALEANRRLVELLSGRRWMVMREAREAGATWAEIGVALGTTRQGAQDWYRRKIEAQEQYLPDLHDAARARAVLDNLDPPAQTATAAHSGQDGTP